MCASKSPRDVGWPRPTVRCAVPSASAAPRTDFAARRRAVPLRTAPVHARCEPVGSEVTHRGYTTARTSAGPLPASPASRRSVVPVTSRRPACGAPTGSFPPAPPHGPTCGAPAGSCVGPSVGTDPAPPTEAAGSGPARSGSRIRAPRSGAREGPGPREALRIGAVWPPVRADGAHDKATTSASAAAGVASAPPGETPEASHRPRYGPVQSPWMWQTSCPPVGAAWATTGRALRTPASCRQAPRR